MTDDLTAQQFAGLRDLGYPQSPAATSGTAPDPPDVIVARQQRLNAAFAEILAHEPSVTPIVCPGTVPVTEEALDAWIDAAPAERKSLHREVARGLCYLEAFRRC